MNNLNPFYRVCIFVSLSIMFYLMSVFIVGYFEIDKWWNKRDNTY
jgi:hypothetical protein